jgi:hypothetical protein
MPVALRDLAPQNTAVFGTFEPMTCWHSAELPGIEPDPEIALNWQNAGSQHAKRRETTCRDLRVHRDALMASARCSRQTSVVTRLVGSPPSKW